MSTTLIAVRLRHEAMAWGQTLLEANYLALFWALFMPPRSPGSLWLGLILLVWSLLLLHVYSTRLLLAKVSPFWLRGVLSGLIALLTWLFAVKVWLFPSAPLTEVVWIRAAFNALPHFAALPPATVLFVLTFFIWWRGLTIGNSHLDFRQFAARFRWHLLLLATGVVLLATINHQGSSTVVWLFFGAAGFTSALKRMEDVGVIVGESGQQFDLRWLGLLAGSSGILILLGAMLGYIFTDRHITAWERLLAPLLALLGLTTKWTIYGLLRLISPLLTWAIHTLAPGGLVLATPTVPAPHNLPAGKPQPVHAAPAWLPIVLRVGGYLLLAALIISIAFFIVAALYKQWQENHIIEETHSTLAGENAADGGSGSFWADRREKLRRLWEQLRYLRNGAELLAAISIRNIYANVTRLAAEQGYPRQPAETPYEYLLSLQQAFPSQQDALCRITEAYVRVEYGHIPTDRGTLATLRRDWQHIKEGNPAPESP